METIPIIFYIISDGNSNYNGRLHGIITENYTKYTAKCTNFLSSVPGAIIKNGTSSSGIGRSFGAESRSPLPMPPEPCRSAVLVRLICALPPPILCIFTVPSFPTSASGPSENVPISPSKQKADSARSESAWLCGVQGIAEGCETVQTNASGRWPKKKNP